MKFADHFERMKKMNRLIRAGQTGTPDEFATILGVSTSHLYRYLAEMEQYGLAINYSRTLKSYYYADNRELEVSYSVKLVTFGHDCQVLAGG